MNESQSIDTEQEKKPSEMGKFSIFLFFISTIFLGWLIIVPFAKAKKLGRGLFIYFILAINTLSFGNLTPSPGTYESGNDLPAILGGLIGSGGITGGISASGQMVGTFVPVVLYFVSWLYLMKLYKKQS